MKFPAIFQTIGLMFLTWVLTVLASAVDLVEYSSPSVVGTYTPFQLTDFYLHPTSLFNPAAYRPDAVQAVLLLASELFAIQAVGAATSPVELDFLCQSFDSSRLQASGYNTTLIKDIFCAAAQGNSLPSLDQIRQLTIEISTFIWIVQAIGTVQGNVQNLCHIISVAGASAIALQGDLVKNDVCAAAAVANKVGTSGQPAALTLTVPTVASIAPVSTIVLPFIPVTPTPTA